MTLKKILKGREISMILLLLGLMAVISLISPNFLSKGNIINIIMNNVILGIMAIGMTLVIVTSGIDVSVGSQLGFSAILVGQIANASNSNIFLVILTGVVVGIVLGSINGFLISWAELPPIVVTLGMLSVYRGGILLYTKGKWVTNLPSWYGQIYNTKILGIPIPLYCLFIVFILTYALIKYTSLGRSVYAYGGNKIAAKRVGIDSAKVNLFVFAYMGLLTGIASILYGSQLGVIEPNAGSNFELSVIAAVVIGGANILGGSASLVGTLIGVMMLGVIQNGMVLMRVETYWQDVVMGAIIIITVSFDILKNKKKMKEASTIEVDSEKVEEVNYDSKDLKVKEV